MGDAAVFVTLPKQCDIVLAPDEAASVAAKLRANPGVLDDLNWHIAAQSAMFGNMTPFQFATRGIRARMRHAAR